MKIRNGLIPLLTLSAFYLSSAQAENEAVKLACSKNAGFLAPAGGTERKYAPDRELQIQHLALDVTPNFQLRSIRGRAELRFKPVARPSREIHLDAVDLQIQSVTSTENIEAWQATDTQVIVTFAKPIPAERETTLTIVYSAEPQRGLYFRTPEMGYKNGDTHLFTQGESVEARYWYPCLDTPNQQFTSEITCRVPKGMTAISNGRLVSQETDTATGLTSIRWLQDKRHANYLISLTAGFFKKLEDRCKDLPLAFYTPPSEIEYAATSFRGTKEMIQFFEDEIGVPYPWDKYDQVCVNDFVAGGMENTSVTTLTDGTLFTTNSENIRNSEGLVSHELAHQWFGDLVTCKDWSHLWLNEGFATYYESLWNAHHNGREAMLYELYERARSITAQTDNTAIVRRTYDQPDQMFGYLVYPKAGWVLHMLRSDLGEDLYRRCIKTYLERHKFGNVVTDDLREVIEQLSGRSFDQFFDQWLYHGHFPELDINYSWDQSARLAKVSVQQVQEVNANVLMFNIPLTIRFKGRQGTVDREIRITMKQEDFYFPLESTPESVRIDPEYTLLARVKFSPPAPMLKAQLGDKEDVIGRLLAVELLKSKNDQDTISRLKDTLSNDPFYGLRIEASKALRSIHSPEALDALIASAKQPDARVRRQVVDDIGGFYDEKSLEVGRQVLETERNPEIICTALRDLGGYNRTGIDELLLARLNSESFRNEVADAAIDALRLQDDPKFIQPLMDTLVKREAVFTTQGFAKALGVLSYLTRNEEHKDGVREFITAQLSSKKRTVQLAAMNALGVLGDPKALPALQKYASAGKDSPQRGAAERAVATLRAGRKPIDDFKNLRQEVLDLQKATREMRKELDELKNKPEARPVAATPSVTSTKVKAKSPKSR